MRAEPAVQRLTAEIGQGPRMQPLAVDVEGLAKLIPLSPSQIELMTRHGQLPVFRAGRRLLFPLTAVAEYLHKEAMANVTTREEGVVEQ